jgi:hypothetical protein
MSGGEVQGGPLILLRSEGAAILVAASTAYVYGGHSWWLFAALFLLPDISMLGYLANPRVGSAAYNAAHTLTAALLLAGVGAVLGSALILSLGAIWLAHIGFDRMLGYGLKYASGFANTHLGQLGTRIGEPAAKRRWRLYRA